MMEYNTRQKRLPLPEYGRSVQKMVDHALTIEEREERQRCAVTEESFKEFLDRGPVFFFGNGAEKCKSIISHPNARFLDGYRNPLAKNMMPLGERAWFDERFEDIAYFEPFYLKNFVATKPKELLKNF